MDDLDRLYRHLVETLRGEAPHLLRQRFAVGDLGQQLVPYRLHRRALGFDTIQQYDRALLRLASGERGYLRTEPVVQDAAREALSRGTDDGDALRRFADAPAALAPEPLGALLGPAPDPRGGGVGAPMPPAPPAPPTAPERPLAAQPVSTSVPDRPGPLPPPPDPVPASAPVREQPPSAMPFPTRPAAAVTGGRCQYCGHGLPEGRPVTFCPYCGHNVTIVRCPACSTELEVGWRFCVTCGRVMDGTEGRPAAGPAPGS